MRPISKQFQKLRFEVGGYSGLDDVLWVWNKEGHILYTSYHGFHRLEKEDRRLEHAFESGQISFQKFVSEVKSPIADDPAAASTVENCAASLLKPHQIQALWEALEIHTFQSKYCDSSICDGAQWELTYQSDGKSFEIEGSNDFPGKWNELVDFLSLFDPKFRVFQFSEIPSYTFRGVPENVKSFARRHKFSDGKRWQDWNGYQVYVLSEVPFDSEKRLCTGYPAFALIKGRGCRLATPVESAILTET